MPSLPPVPNVAKVAVNGTMGTTRWTNVFHVRYTTGAALTQAQADALASGVHGAFAAHFSPIQTNDCILQNTVATDLSSNTGVQSTHTAQTVGTLTGSAAPANLAYLINWKINRRYRGGHPRTYIAGVEESIVDDAGVISSPTGITNAAAAFLVAVNLIDVNGGSTSTCDLCTVHYKKANDVWTLVGTDDIVGSAVNPLVGVQRRRVRR